MTILLQISLLSYERWLFGNSNVKVIMWNTTASLMNLLILHRFLKLPHLNQKRGVGTFMLSCSWFRNAIFFLFPLALLCKHASPAPLEARIPHARPVHQHGGPHGLVSLLEVLGVSVGDDHLFSPREVCGKKTEGPVAKNALRDMWDSRNHPDNKRAMAL